MGTMFKDTKSLNLLIQPFHFQRFIAEGKLAQISETYARSSSEHYLRKQTYCKHPRCPSAGDRLSGFTNSICHPWQIKTILVFILINRRNHQWCSSLWGIGTDQSYETTYLICTRIMHIECKHKLLRSKEVCINALLFSFSSLWCDFLCICMNLGYQQKLIQHTTSWGVFPLSQYLPDKDVPLRVFNDLHFPKKSAITKLRHTGRRKALGLWPALH